MSEQSRIDQLEAQNAAYAETIAMMQRDILALREAANAAERWFSRRLNQTGLGNGPNDDLFAGRQLKSALERTQGYVS